MHLYRSMRALASLLHKELTSEYIPPLPSNSFMSAAKLSPEFSSSILEIQSSFPVQIRTCSA